MEYYKRTDLSIAWMAALVLNPRFKWRYFEDNWRGVPSLARTINPSKTKLKKLWTDKYKRLPEEERFASVSPAPEEEEEEPDFFKDLLSKVAPTTLEEEVIATPNTVQDQLACYLAEPPNVRLGLMEYWKSREAKWPQLAKMAYDFLAVPAMSSECERVFSSVSKQTTAHASRLSGEMLWQQECLSNWQRRGAIRLEAAFNAVLLDYSSK